MTPSVKILRGAVEFTVITRYGLRLTMVSTQMHGHEKMVSKIVIHKATMPQTKTFNLAIAFVLTEKQ